MRIITEKGPTTSYQEIKRKDGAGLVMSTGTIPWVAHNMDPPGKCITGRPEEKLNYRKGRKWGGIQHWTQDIHQCPTMHKRTK